MWVVTVFEKNSYAIFEYETKQEALNVMKNIQKPAILSYTNLSYAA